MNRLKYLACSRWQDVNATALVLLIWAMAVLSGCTGAPDRQAQADHLVQEIRAMPGVSDASVSYENAIARGANLAVDVYVPAATGQQITDVWMR
jgi:hypothetical protein